MATGADKRSVFTVYVETAPAPVEPTPEAPAAPATEDAPAGLATAPVSEPPSLRERLFAALRMAGTPRS